MRKTILRILVGLAAVFLLTGTVQEAEGVSATGGTVTNYTDGGGTNWTAHIFTNTAATSIVFSFGGNVEVLLVGGGGGGGRRLGGGGGAGGYVYTSSTVSAQSYAIQVGTGGLGGVEAVGVGGNGGNSTFNLLVAHGGGGGAGSAGTNRPAASGGSGGGGCIESSTTNGAAGISGEGNAGGKGLVSPLAAGGGGGAGTTGTDASIALNKAGDGGAGITNSISGIAVAYAGGGGGAGYHPQNVIGGFGGSGGGGNGAGFNNLQGQPGTNGLGGGGGGSDISIAGSPGGSGIVIVRYVGGTEYFVSTNGLDSNSGTNWGQSLRTISNAVAKAVNPGDIVTVSNGTYNISADIMVTQAITIRSFGNGITGGLTNAANTILSRGNGRWNFYITAAATVDGFTGTGCQAGNGGGGNFYVSAGAMVYNCILRNNYGGYNTKGFGGYIVSGIISNCLIYGNYNTDRQTWGGGLYMDGGTVVACKIYSNNMLTVVNQSSGGGVYVRDGTVRNCLIYGNAAGDGGGVFIEGGTVESCTIAGNIVSIAGPSTGRGGGIYRNGSTAGTVLNCIVYNNTALDATYKNSYSAPSGWTYNDSTLPDVAGTGCISTDPKLTNDYTLLASSPCIDVGTNQSWMTSATDLFRNPRKVLGGGVNSADPIVDMGAYEYGWQAEPIIKNQLPSNSTTNSATFNGWLVSTGFSDNAVCVHWGMSNGTTNNGAWVNTNWFTGISWTNNSFPSTNLIGLVTDTTYYYTFIASNVAGVVAATLPTNVMYLITGGVTVDSSGDSTVKYPTDMTGTFTISRPIGASSESLIVSYSTTNGSPTATNGIDYALSGASLLNSGTAATGSVYMAAGSSNVVLTLIPLSEVPVNKSAILTLTTGVGNYALGVVTQQTITILAAPSTVQFWTGATNSQWTNSANWTNSAGAGVVPTNLPYSAVINGGANQPIVLNLANGPFTIASLALGQSVGSTLSVQNGNVDTKILIVTNDVVIGQAGYLTHAAETAGGSTVGNENHRLCLVVSNNMTIAAGGQINVVGMGYAVAQGPGAPTVVIYNANGPRGGGGYGGQGGIYNTATITYGSITNPVNNGSGGYPAAGASAGGGCVVLRVTGAVTHNGTITARGLDSTYRGPGSGGSINVTASSITGSGVMSADGGVNVEGTGHGGGGRIAVKLTGGGTVPDSILTNITACSPLPDVNSSAAGTIYIQDGSRTNLIVDQKSRTSFGTFASIVSPYTLLRNDTNQYSTIIVTNSAMLMVGTNAQLNLDGCTLLTLPSTTNSITSRLIVGKDNGTLNWTGTWTNNGCISWYGNNYANVWTGSLVVASNAFLTHEYGGGNAIRLSLTGDLNVTNGGSVYVSGRGNAGISPPARMGSGHGGEGGIGMVDGGGPVRGTTYGSIINPITQGSQGSYQNPVGYAGGVAILRVAGTLLVNGSVAADGISGGSGSSAGSVNVVAGEILGSGSITANGGDANNNGGGGGGGRIAIVLTNTALFGGVAISAVGGTAPIGGAPPWEYGGAGTIYLKGTNQTYGTLILDNGSRSTVAKTVISPSVTDYAQFDDVVLRNLAFLDLNTNTMSVYGNWSNMVSGVAMANGTVIFAGSNPQYIYGDNNWSNLTFSTAGTTIYFQPVKTQRIIGTLTNQSPTTFRSITDGAGWRLTKTGTGIESLSGVIFVKDSDASGGKTMSTPFASRDLGGNINWLFTSGIKIQQYFNIFDARNLLDP